MNVTTTAIPWLPRARWAYRIAALIAAGVCVRAWYLHRIGGSWTMIPLNLLPFALLEALGRLPRSQLSAVIFAAGALCISAVLIFHAPYFSGGSGEWSRLNFLLIPMVQMAGVTVLALVLGVFRWLKW